jgi:hypothetical protein
MLNINRFEMDFLQCSGIRNNSISFVSFFVILMQKCLHSTSCLHVTKEDNYLTTPTGLSDNTLVVEPFIPNSFC